MWHIINVTSKIRCRGQHDTTYQHFYPTGEGGGGVLARHFCTAGYSLGPFGRSNCTIVSYAHKIPDHAHSILECYTCIPTRFPRAIPFNSPRSLRIASASGIVFWKMIPSTDPHERTSHSKKSISSVLNDSWILWIHASHDIGTRSCVLRIFRLPGGCQLERHRIESFRGL